MIATAPFFLTWSCSSKTQLLHSITFDGDNSISAHQFIQRFFVELPQPKLSLRHTAKEEDPLATLLSSSCTLSQGLDLQLNLTQTQCVVRKVEKAHRGQRHTRVLSYEWFDAFDPCTLSVFLVAYGEKYVSGPQSALKSVLFHRNNPIRFDILTRRNELEAWEQWFDSANVPYLQVFFHMLEDFQTGIEEDLGLETGSGFAALTQLCGAHNKCPVIGTYAVPHLVIDRQIDAETFPSPGVTVMLAHDLVYNNDPMDLVKEFVLKDKNGAGLFMGARAHLYDTHPARKSSWIVPDDGGVSTPSVYFTGRMNSVGYSKMLNSSIANVLAQNPNAHEHGVADMDMVTAVAYYYPESLIKGGCSSMYDAFMFWNHDWRMLPGGDVHAQWCYDSPLGILHLGMGYRNESTTVPNSLIPWVSKVFSSYDILPLKVLQRCPTFIDNYGPNKTSTAPPPH